MTHVWCAEVSSNLKAFASYKFPTSNSEERKAMISIAAKNRLGYELSAQDIPPFVTSMETVPDPLTDYAFISGRIPMVSPKLAALLKTLDIGESKFFETQFRAEDSVTPLAHNHLVWNFANRKDTLVATACRDIFRLKTTRPGRTIPETYASKGLTDDDDIAVTAAALTGADFWVETKFNDAVFFSARFEKLMSDNGLRDLFGLKSVRVVE